MGLPGGSMAVYNSSGLAYYRHSDWIGSSRLASTPSRAMYSDGAYGPFGEPYAQAGSTDLSFTGMNQDTVANLYDFPAREYGIQGRWPSPDPSGISAVDPTDPQTWNRYAYVRNNPLSLTDPTGRQLVYRYPGGMGGAAMFAMLSGDNFTDWGGGGGDPFSGGGANGGGFCDAAGDCGYSTGVDGMPTGNLGPGSNMASMMGAAPLLAAQAQYTAGVNYTIEGNWLASGFIVQRGPGGVYYNPDLAAAAAFDLIFSAYGDAGCPRLSGWIFR